MKKLILASAVAALSVTAAQAAPTIYGKAFLTLDANKTKTEDSAGATTEDTSRTRLNSNGSRIGFKGSEALNSNLDLVYQLEYGVDIDSGTKKELVRDDTGSVVLDANGNPTYENVKRDQFYSRDTYLGLSHKQYGTLLAGRLKAIDGQVDYANVTQGGIVGGDNVMASFDAPRADNALAYISPKYNDIQFLGMYVMEEDVVDHDIWGVGVKYEPKNAPYKGGATYIQQGNFKAARISGAYDLNLTGKPVTLGALYQLTKDDAAKEHAVTVSGEMEVFGPWTGYAQGDYVKNVAGDEDRDLYRIALGGKYGFSKSTIGHIYGAYLQDKDDNGTDVKQFGVGGGLEYKF